MKRSILVASGFSLAVALAFSVPSRSQEQAPTCPGDPTWLNAAKPFDGTEPADKEDECAFYQRSWQAFLHITSPGTDGAPAFLQDYATFRTLFLKQKAQKFRGRNMMMLTIRTPEEPSPVFDGGIDQASSSAVIDRNGNPLFYSISVDPVFEQFIRDKHLDDVTVVRGAQDPSIPDGAIEIKASWQIVADPAAAKGFITTVAMVPALKQVRDGVHADTTAPTRRVTVALLGIHVVFKLTNHPEFIWATFEHIDGAREFDLTPRAASLPVADRNAVVANKDYILYRANTTYDQGNQELLPMTLQADGTVKERSSIYRLYPWSQIADPAGKPPAEDDDIAAVNTSVLDQLAKTLPSDVRRNYKLVGAVWLRKGSPDFHVGTRIQDGDLLGEKGLSNMAIESMTQDFAPHCFSCHNPVKGGGMPAKAMNVSHLFEMFSKSH